MADFTQNGVIGTLHNLRQKTIDEFEAELTEFSKTTPMALILPSLYSELQGPALQPIIEKLAKVPYLEEIIIGLDRANEDEFNHAKEFFGQLPQRHVILWNDGPAMLGIDAVIKERKLAPLEPGKGRNVWYCLGYFLASNRSKAVALHDCDIVTYERDMLARLFYPITCPAFNYVFTKGYYYRSDGDKLNGRVFRLLVTPLIHALKKTLGPSEYLDYMGSFRYALAGEFAMRSDAVRNLRIPTDWGLEIGILSEMQRNFAPHRVCQVDIADAYDHKHQDLSPEDASRGLNRMAVDICKAFIRKLAVNGVVFTPHLFRTLKACYFRTALDMIDHYYQDAVMSGITLDRHKETEAVEMFGQSLMDAGSAFLDNPMEAPFISSWSRVTSAIPDIKQYILDAVAHDNPGVDL